MPNETTQIDPSVVALMHGLKTAEGTNGNYNAVGDEGTAAGIGQWSNQVNGKPVKLQPGQVPANFQNDAQEYGLDPTDFSPENQNKVMYAAIAKDKADGLTPEQILSKWNSGDPNKYQTETTDQQGPVGTYNVGAYVQRGMLAAQQYAAQQRSQTIAGPNQPAPQQNPSIGGFMGNVVQSGANFLGNIGNAVLHPIDTVQGIGSMAVGGLQELGGQQNQNTQAFDNLKNYFANRYGGVSNLEHTMYTDPVGFLADLSTVIGGAGAAAKGVSLAGKLGGLAEVADTAGAASDALGSASMATNPLTPVIKGVGKLASASKGLALEGVSQVLGKQPSTIEQIFENPDAFNPEEAIKYSREQLAQEVAGAIISKQDLLEETGSGYDPVRASTQMLKVAPNFLEQSLREAAGVDVEDGQIVASGASKVRAARDVNQLQQLFNTWKPVFQRGDMTANEFLNFRQDLANVAKYDREFTASRAVESVAAQIRSAFNDSYRSQIPGLEFQDADYAAQRADLETLTKGILNKDGSFKDNFMSTVANAGNKGKEAVLGRLEQLTPGITQRLKIMRALEDLDNNGIRVGTYTRSLAQAARVGGIIFGATTGNIKMLAYALAMDMVSRPETIVPMLQMMAKLRPEVVAPTVNLLAAYATRGAVANAVASGAESNPPQTPGNTEAPQNKTQTSGTQTSQSGQDLQSVPSDLATLANDKGFDLQSALKAGYSPDEIRSYLEQQ